MIFIRDTSLCPFRAPSHAAGTSHACEVGCSKEVSTPSTCYRTSRWDGLWVLSKTAPRAWHCRLATCSTDKIQLNPHISGTIIAGPQAGYHAKDTRDSKVQIKNPKKEPFVVRMLADPRFACKWCRQHMNDSFT